MYGTGINQESMAKDKIIFHKKWRDAIKDFPTEVRLEVYDAIVQYAFDDKVHEFVYPMAKMAFVFIKIDIDTTTKRQDEISIKRRLAGKKGGKVKAKSKTEKNKNKVISIAETTQSLPEPPKQEVQQKAVRNKKPIKKQYAEYVLLAEEEYQNLVNKHGEDAIQWMITKLDNYKASSGKKYQSDYRAILNWVVEDYYKTKGYGSKNTRRATEIAQCPSKSTYSSTL